MNTITIILVALALLVICVAVIYVLIKDRKNLKKEISRLNDEVASAKMNVEQMRSYVDTILDVKKDKEKISERIKEAKTDEEVNSIIADIVHTNNDKLQND